MTVICEICEIWIFSLLSCHCISGTEMQRGRSNQGCDNAITPTLPFAVLDGSWLCFTTSAISALHPFFSLHTILSSSVSSIIFPSLFCSFQYLPPSMTMPHTLPFTHVLSPVELFFLPCLRHLLLCLSNYRGHFPFQNGKQPVSLISSFANSNLSVTAPSCFSAGSLLQFCWEYHHLSHQCTRWGQVRGWSQLLPCRDPQLNSPSLTVRLTLCKPLLGKAARVR